MNDALGQFSPVAPGTQAAGNGYEVLGHMASPVDDTQFAVEFRYTTRRGRHLR